MARPTRAPRDDRRSAAASRAPHSLTRPRSSTSISRSRIGSQPSASPSRRPISRSRSASSPTRSPICRHALDAKAAVARVRRRLARAPGLRADARRRAPPIPTASSSSSPGARPAPTPIEHTLDRRLHAVLRARHQAPGDRHRASRGHRDRRARDRARRAAGRRRSTLGVRPSVLAWVRYGMDHIYCGRDHISFVLALLLVVMLEREDATLAHAPPARDAEAHRDDHHRVHDRPLDLADRSRRSATSSCRRGSSRRTIAVSIAYTAIEDIIHPDVRWRFVLTFGVRARARPRLRVRAPGSLAIGSRHRPARSRFNVGVELGQLTIVLVALPLLWLAARELARDTLPSHRDARRSHRSSSSSD